MNNITKRLSAVGTRLSLLLLLMALLPNMASAQCPDNNHPHMIDLGLPSGTKWACCNVGSTMPEGYGGYYAWGETEEKSSYNSSNYLDGNGTSYDIGTDIAGTQYDAATANWGSPWVMPNYEQMFELTSYCSSEWMTENSVNGCRFTGLNGASIFIPAAGFRFKSQLRDAGGAGFYWLSTLYEYTMGDAWSLRFGGSNVSMVEGGRYYGRSVRPVVVGSGLSTPIEFADPAVKALCVANWDTNGDGELSYDEAAAVGGLGDVFRYNQEITSFNELQYFIGLREIGERAFMGSSLTSIIIPNNVSYIIQYAFENCYNLTSVTLGNRVEEIGDRAFNMCYNLTTLNIPNSVAKIGNDAFLNCMALTTLNIPKNVTTIGEEAFKNCNGLTSIVIEEANPVYDSRNNCNAIIKTQENMLMVGCMNSIIPSSVVSIGNQAFYNCNGMISLTIPSSVVSIGDEAFYSCSGLTTIIVEEGNPVYDSRNNCNAIINTADNELMVGCVNTIIPTDVISIGESAFRRCVGLTSIVIPNSVTSIGNSAFFGCSGLTSIIVENGNSYYDSRNNCNAIIETATNTLILGCNNTIIPNDLTSIGNDAFYNCSGLISVTIPNSVTSIRDHAFSGCSGLTEVRSMITEPFEINRNVFNVYNLGDFTTATLYVPAGTKDKYEATPAWNLFQNIVEMDLAPVDSGETVDFGSDIDGDTDLDGNVVGDIYYNISSGDGGYNVGEGCIVVTTPTDDSVIDGQDIFGEDFQAGFTGIVFKVPAGKGTIKVEAETTGTMVLKVKIGDAEPVTMELEGRLKVSFPYNVSEPTYVYIYGGTTAGAPDMAGHAAANGELKLYGIEVTSDETGISPIDHSTLNIEHYYTLDGRMLQGEPTQKGVYIVNGHKVVIK